MTFRVVRNLLMIIAGALVLVLMPISVSAQNNALESDHPLMAAPGSSGGGAEPERLIGNYCGAFGGISLQAEPEQTFDVEVPGKPIAAYIYWSGRDQQGAPGDNTLSISKNGGPFQEVTATVATTANSDGNYRWFTYSYAALQGSDPLITEGSNSLRVTGLSTAERHGVGALVVYENLAACPYQQIDLFFGNDVLYKGWNGSSGPHSEVTCVDFPAPPAPIELDIQMFVGGIENDLRSDSIWHASGSGARPANLVGEVFATSLQEQLAGLTGDEFDNYDTFIQDPQPIVVDAGDTWACFQIESPQPPNPGKTLGISATWINLAVRTPLATINITPDGLNPLNDPHVFTISVDSSVSYERVTITPTVEPEPKSLTHTCDTPIIDGASATCTLTINSDVVGEFVATARATIDLGDMAAEVVTNGRGGNSGPAVKTYYLPAAIGDRVFGDSNPNGKTPSEILAGNGVQDEGEQGVDGIIVQLYDENDNFISQTSTDENGYYEFNKLVPGDYYVVFINPLNEGIWTTANVGGNDAADSDVDPFMELTVDTGVDGDAIRTELTTLEPGEFDQTWDAGLVGLSTLGSSALGDRVWLDLDKDGRQDDASGESGIPGVTVRLYRESVTKSMEYHSELQTGQDGVYFFDALDPGTYLIEFLLPGGHKVSPRNSVANRSVDSDAEASSGRTVEITLPAYMHDRTWDAGVYQVPTAITVTDEPDPGSEAILLDNHIFLPHVSR